MNGVIIQFFHWYHPGDLWKEFIEKAEELEAFGFTAVWFPPAVKCAGGIDGRGYDVYDLYDLGEFDQKGTIATRYGSKKEYLDAIEKAHDAGLQVYADIVLNHRLGADELETVLVQEVSDNDRNQKINEPFQAQAHTKFILPGRKGKYSEFVWDHNCFSGIDCLKKDDEDKTGIFKIHNQYGTEWDDAVSQEFGNYDYLMGSDVEFRNPFVVEELQKWIKWYIETTKVDGLRLDALKHISSDFMKDFISYIRSDIDSGIFCVGEFWKGCEKSLLEFSEKMEHALSLFDVPLHYNFYRASQEKSSYDFTRIFKNTIFEKDPKKAVSFVGNHDTQKLQSLESTVENWFRPLAYALILLSENAYPCVFYPDLYGAEYSDKNKDGDVIKIKMPKVDILPKLLMARQRFATGKQTDYFDHPNCIAWVRSGENGTGGCVVIISNSEEGFKEVKLGKVNAGKKYVDFLDIRSDVVTLNESGTGRFWVDPSSVSVWIQN